MKVVFTKQEVIALARAAATYETIIGKAKLSLASDDKVFSMAIEKIVSPEYDNSSISAVLLPDESIAVTINQLLVIDVLEIYGDLVTTVFTLATTYKHRMEVLEAKYSKKNSKYWSYNTRCKNSN